MPGRAVVAGSVAQRPGRGGHTWVFLQYVLGLRRLGYEVLLLDRLDPAMCADRGAKPRSPQNSENLRYFRRVVERFGLGGSWAVRCREENGTEWFAGLSRNRVLEFARDADFLLNVMGFLEDEAILGAVPRRVFLDIDPGFPQMWRDLGLADVLAGHDTFATVGLNVGHPGCSIPTCGRRWITTPPPVVLEQWPAAPERPGRPRRRRSGAPHQSRATADGSVACRDGDPAHRPPGRFTTIATWRGGYGPVTYRGRMHGLRVHEFRKFVELPSRTRVPLELALDIHPAEIGDLGLLQSHGWALVNPLEVASDPWTYRDYIRRSFAEFMVAKNMYVVTQSGWFSDRSACYLASGRPVLAQDTGLAEHVSVGEGLLTYNSLDEAAAGAEAVVAEPERHARAARELAEEYFDSDRVLGRLVDRLGSPSQESEAPSVAEVRP